MCSRGNALKTWAEHMKLLVLTGLLTPPYALFWNYLAQLVLGANSPWESSPFFFVARSLLVVYAILGCIYVITGRPRLLADKH